MSTLHHLHSTGQLGTGTPSLPVNRREGFSCLRHCCPPPPPSTRFLSSFAQELVTRHHARALSCRAQVAESSSSSPRSACFFELGSGQSRLFHELPSGFKLEAIHQRASTASGKRPPIVFIHGSFHAAWCWAVHWLPFFAAKGHDCLALSLLGQGESDCPEEGAGVTLQSHARDIAHFIRQKTSVPPILLGHSAGGFIVQHYLAHMAGATSETCVTPLAEGSEELYPVLAAAILACSVPPRGNGSLVQRYIMTKPITSIKVTLSFAAKAFAYNLSLCKETFFSKEMPTSLVELYQGFLAKSTKIPLLTPRDLNASLLVQDHAVHRVPILVIGAEDDFVVDVQGVEETAAFYSTQALMLPHTAHDIMLDTRWEKAADLVSKWISMTVL